MRKRGMDHDIVQTSRKDEAVDLSRMGCLKDEHDVIVAMGGDGTICEVITGMMRAGSGKMPRPCLGVIHIGTSPDFNRYHSIPFSPLSQLDVIERGRSRKIDIGRVELKGFSGTMEKWYFGSSVNLGLGPSIASRSNGRYRRFLGDMLGTLLSTLVSLAGYDPSDIEARIDGKGVTYKDLINLTVGKDPHLASGMRVPIAMPDDNGRMYCLSIETASKFALLPQIKKMYAGNILDYRGARLIYCSKFEVQNSTNRKVEFDGDHRGFLPVKVDLVEKGLEVIMDV